jgi:hypoxanthine phosphoribosyltransferase
MMEEPRKLPRELISVVAIQKRVSELGAQIREDLSHDDDVLIVLSVLKGSFMFAADLVRGMDVPMHVEFVRASSYGLERVSSGSVRVWENSWDDLTGRDVLVVEDIADTGRTLQAVTETARNHGARSVQSVVLLKKTGSSVNPDYVGFDIGDEFVVGYGLDDAELWRNLPWIGIVGE